ncbi:MAG: hypothetical protein IT371_24465 [Deltaproteobacteria bacterium]|nr:hypothetical protein [Deltaproteobacteria bacterium]
MPPRPVGHVVSHTHWDRAWYLTAEATRVRLVEMMDALLELLGREPAFRSFTLDGQMAMVLDYLAVRPEREEELRRLARAGRLELGPFFVLPDLFLPSGESLVRNLCLGQRLARAFARPSRVGYLPDPFGHPAQLPQILAAFGLTGAIVARGLGDEGEALGSDFLWEAPDGTRLHTTHQVGGGYCNAARLGEEPASDSGAAPPAPFAARLARARARLESLRREMEPYCPHGHLLLNNGCDLLPAQEDLPELLAALGRDPRAPLRLRHTSFARYQAAVRHAASRGAFTPWTYRGELRGGRYANLLPGVLSARVDLKLAHDRAERLLLDWVEPFTALTSLLGRGTDAGGLLELAWRELLLCQPHDDLCGCSIDAVHADDTNRLARVTQLGEALLESALKGLATAAAFAPTATAAQQPAAASATSARPASPRAVVFNPHPWSVRAVVELPLAPRVASHDGGLPPQHPGPNGSEALLALPPLGYALCCPTSSRGAPPAPLPAPVILTRRRGALRLDNGLVALTVSPRGELSLTHHATGLIFRRLAELVDEGDAGDTYDFSPPAQQGLVRGPSRAPTLRVMHRSPLRAELDLSFALSLPVGLTADRRARTRQVRAVPVSLRVLVTAGAPRLELQLTVENTCDDHRLRLAIPAPFATDAALTGAPFQLVRRPLALPKTSGWAQPPGPTHPCSGFVALEGPRGGLALSAPGLHEVEARHTPRGTKLLITLLRSVRWLSRADLTTRKGNAGPPWPVEGARQRGSTTFRVAVIPFADALIDSDALRQAAEHASPPRVVTLEAGSPLAPPRRPLPPRASFLTVKPAAVQVTALRRAPGRALELRLVNLSDTAQLARLEGPLVATHRLRLDGKRLGPLAEPDRVPLRPFEIATVRLAASPSPRKRRPQAKRRSP